MDTSTLRRPRTTHSFTLVFGGTFDELPADLLDAMPEADGDDSTISLRAGVLRIGFDREAPSHRSALLSAVADVERSGAGLDLARIEPE